MVSRVVDNDTNMKFDSVSTIYNISIPIAGNAVHGFDFACM